MDQHTNIRSTYKHTGVCYMSYIDSVHRTPYLAHILTDRPSVCVVMVVSMLKNTMCASVMWVLNQYGVTVQWLHSVLMDECVLAQWLHSVFML